MRPRIGSRTFCLGIAAVSVGPACITGPVWDARNLHGPVPVPPRQPRLTVFCQVDGTTRLPVMGPAGVVRVGKEAHALQQAIATLLPANDGAAAPWRRPTHRWCLLGVPATTGFGRGSRRTFVPRIVVASSGPRPCAGVGVARHDQRGPPAEAARRGGNVLPPGSHPLACLSSTPPET
jgi:hypothetical protein